MRLVIVKPSCARAKSRHNNDVSIGCQNILCKFEMKRNDMPAKASLIIIFDNVSITQSNKFNIEVIKKEVSKNFKCNNVSRKLIT